MKVVNPRSTYSCLLTLILTINSVFMIFYVCKLMATGKNEIDSELEDFNNKLNLELDIMDIYRLDISCDYITKALSQKVSTHYRNKNKKCSLSSLNSNVNELVLKSMNNTLSKPYSPLFNLTAAVNFDPLNTQNEYVDQYSQFQSLKSGGFFEPQLKKSSECSNSDLDNIVFIVPFSQSRVDNLKLFLINMHSYLQAAVYKFNYRIIVVEQSMKSQDLFNKGRLINRAVKYAIENIKQIDCLIIHDVDLVPSEGSEFILDKGDYRCRQMPWHMSNEVYSLSKKESRVYNSFLTGGILSLRPGHFIQANGFSNEYFGWGAEDDDFTLRMFSSRLCIMRSNNQISSTMAPFVMLEHSASRTNTDRFKQLTNCLRAKKIDGYSNIEYLTEIKSVSFYLTFTHLLVDVNKN